MGKAQHKHRKSRPPRPARSTGPPDGAVYIGVLMIGVFGVGLWSILSDDPQGWKHGLLGYVIAVAALVNFFAWRAWFGARLAPWQKSMARLVHRFAGFGTRRGKPLAAAHGNERAQLMLFLSLAFSALVIAAVTWVLYGV